MRYLLVLFSLFALTGCGRYHNGNECKLCVPFNVQEQMTRHACATATKFQFEDRLFLEDSKYFCVDGQIYGARFDFSTMALLELRQGRELLVDVVEDYLARVNSDPLIRPYLYQGRIDPSELTLYINFKADWGFYLDYEYVGWISLERGCSKFYAFDVRTTRTRCIHLRTENYWNSEEIVRISREEEKAYFDSLDKEKDNTFGGQRYLPDEN